MIAKDSYAFECFNGALSIYFILRLRPCRRPLYSGLLFVGCVFRFSAEICVVSGCSFAVTCFTNHGDFGTDVVSFGGQNVSFGMLVASNLAPWGPSSDSGGLGSTRRETLGFQAWISVDFDEFRDRHMGVLGNLWNNNCVFWHACLQVAFFKDFGV